MAFAKKKKVVKAEEKPVTIVEENEIKDEAIEEVVNTSTEEIIASENDKISELGTVGGSSVKAEVRGIRYEAYHTPVPMFLLPSDIQSYLLTNGFGTDVWMKDKEWLEKHGADMKMIEKLKKFLSDRYNGIN